MGEMWKETIDRTLDTSFNVYEVSGSSILPTAVANTNIITGSLTRI